MGDFIMSLAALIVAILSLVVAVSALCWQVVTWQINGGRVRVQLVHGVVGAGGVVTTPIRRDNTAVDIDALRGLGWHGPEMLGVVVTNTGRADVHVTGTAFWHPTSRTALSFPGGNALSPRLPDTVSPGTTETWYLDLVEGRALVRAMNEAEQLRGRQLQMRVTLGSGKTKTTRGSLQV